MKTPLLSILVPSIPSRLAGAVSMFDYLTEQCGTNLSGNVEILMLTDNKQRSVGMKRQALLGIARGDYVCFADDDDFISQHYVSSIIKAIQEDHPDVIVWPFKVTINGGREGIVLPSIAHMNKPIPEYEPPVTYRPPHHLCCWKREIAIKGRFPDLMEGEDFAWAAQCWPYVKTERQIDKVLYHYRWDRAVTEAK